MLTVDSAPSACPKSLLSALLRLKAPYRDIQAQLQWQMLYQRKILHMKLPVLIQSLWTFLQFHNASDHSTKVPLHHWCVVALLSWRSACKQGLCLQWCHGTHKQVPSSWLTAQSQLHSSIDAMLLRWCYVTSTDVGASSGIPASALVFSRWCYE